MLLGIFKSRRQRDLIHLRELESRVQVLEERELLLKVLVYQADVLLHWVNKVRSNPSMLQTEPEIGIFLSRLENLLGEVGDAIGMERIRPVN